MILGIIPARYASTRFPGKPLADIGGKSMIRRVCEQASAAARVDRIVVATDDPRIFDHVKAFGAEVLMTDPEHPSGTDRCAEVLKHFPEATHVLNIQGDEPFIQPEQIDLLVETLLAGDSVQIATLAKKINDAGSLFNPNVVKVVFSSAQEALYFSRQPIPYVRGTAPEAWLSSARDFYKHIGLYGFRADRLLDLARLAQTPLERAESLEQLRWLENGYRISVGITEMETIGIDTPEDLNKVGNER